MRKKIFLPVLLVVCTLLSFHITRDVLIPTQEAEKEGSAQDMFDWWYSQRALPFGFIPAGAFQKAALYSKNIMRKERRTFGETAIADQWVSIGPNNVGGRVLSLAINPVNPNIIWAGSASGGLWKSTTGGAGAHGWTYINTGYNALSISAIAIDPTNPNRMYLGTGEVSFYHAGMEGTPGARSSYGIGILRSLDSGVTWNLTTLAFSLPEVTAVEKIIINPVNSNTLFAATSEGVYKSTNAGFQWTKISSSLMVMDVIMDPSDTSTLYQARGNLNSTIDPGIYKSRDAGATWRQLTNGLPSSNFGRTALTISPAAPHTVYAGIADANSSYLLGLYMSSDSGASWTKSNGSYDLSGQGWYNNILIANPHTPDSLYGGGIDIYSSTDGGNTMNRKSVWSAYFLGFIAPGGTEGQPWYAHADHHAVAFDPNYSKTIYFGCDGGVFKTTDGGDTFIGCNGGLVTTQFYNGFANAANDSSFATGGLQDNGTLKYQGTTEWNKIGEYDGGWTAINSTNTNFVYAEYQWGTILRSTFGGPNFSQIPAGLPPSGSSSTDCNFISPFVISYSNPSILYAGARNVFKTTNGGNSWSATNGGFNLNGTKISALAVSYSSPDTAFAATGSSASQGPKFAVYVTTNGGQFWLAETSGLPNRYPTDIEFDPTDSKTAYVTFSGYGTGHIFRTTNLGQTWTNISSGVDIPHQSVVVDPLDPEQIYVGTDLGVYHSSNSGATWEEFNAGMMPAMVLDLGISRANSALRAATFGNGAFQRKLYRPPTVLLASPNGGEVFGGGEVTSIQWSSKFISNVKLEYSLDSGNSWNTIIASTPAPAHSYAWSVPNIGTTNGTIRISDAGSGSPVDECDSSFTIIAGPDVFSGWNMISLNLLVPDARKSTLFPSAISSAFAYSGAYVAADTLQPGIGYWLKFDAPQNTTYSGDSILADTIHVTAGWNMIGALSAPVAVSSITSLPPGIISSAFFGYNSGYYVADSLRPKQGYWINVSSDGELILNSGTMQSAKRTEMDGVSSFNVITFSDAAGRRQSLYFTARAIETRIYQMPPLAPEEVFDVRFNSQRFVESAGAKVFSAFPLLLHGIRYPLTIRWDIKEAAIKQAALRVDRQSVSLVGNGAMILRAQPGDPLALELKSTGRSELPTTFSLGQNYPNPFNPTTTFEFSIADNQLVSLKVYDVVGREVASIINDRLSAGSYVRTWDASNLPSGIYYYRLTAGSLTQTRKMILLK